jgi:hypothetical protein
MPEPTLTINLSALQLEGFDPGETIKPREPKVSDDGVLNIGKPDGSTWRYLPEGYGPALATSAQLQQLSDDLQSLRDIAATDSDLASELADIQATIDALIASGATDSELAAAIGPIQAAIALLVSADSTTATAIAAVQASVAGLDQTYATDAQLNQAIAALGLPVRSTTPPVFAPNVRWTELNADGSELYPWAWTAFNRGTIEFPQWDWRGPELVAAAAIQAGATTQTIRIPYPWRSRGTAAVKYRAIEARTTYSAAAAAGATNWSIVGFLERTATSAAQPRAQITFASWFLVNNEGKAQTSAFSTGSLVSIPLIDEDAGGIAVTITPFAAGYTRSAIGAISFTFAPVRL